MPRFFRTIRWRLFLLQLAGIGTMALAAVMGWFVSIDPALRLSVAKTQLEIAKRAAGQISDFLQMRVRELETTVEIGRFFDQDKQRQQEALQRLLKLSPDVSEASLVTLTGEEILRMSRLRVMTDDDLRVLTRLPIFRAAAKGEVAFGPVYHSMAAEPHFSIAVPFKLSAKEIGGVIRAEINLRSLWRSVSSVQVGKSGHLYVVDRKGKLIAHPDYSKVLLNANMLGVPEVAEFLGSPEFDPRLGEIVAGEQGGQVITTTASVQDTGWGVIVEESVETALADARQLKLLAGAMLLVAVAGAMMVSFYFSHSVSEPIRAMQEGAEVIARGDLDHRLSIQTGDELEFLAEKFNRMAVSLQESYSGLERKITERTKEISALYSALAPLKPFESLNAMLNGVIERLIEATGADAALIRLWDSQTQRLVCPAARGFTDEYLAGTATPGPGSGMEAVFKSGQPIIAADLAADARLKGKKQLATGMRSCALLPLIVVGEHRGVIHVASRSIGFFHSGKQDHLMAIARQMSVAVENHELFVEMRRNLERIRALHEIDNAIASSLDLKTVLDVLLEKIELFLPFPAATTIRLLNRQTGMLEPITCRGLDEAQWRKSSAIYARGNPIIENKTTVTVLDVQKEPGPLDPEFLAENHLSSLLVVPLIANDEAFGVLSFYSLERHEFNAVEKEFLVTLAGQASIAIQNSTLYGNLQSQAAALERSNEVKSEFLGIMSHELTTPITVMMGYATLIEEEVVGPASDEQKEAIRVIRRKGAELVSMIRGILEATKLESGDCEVEMAPVDLHDLLRTLELESIVPPGKDVSISWNYEEALPQLHTDGAKLKQILAHLIDNGVKFTAEGRVDVSAVHHHETQSVHFAVADTGVGIPDDMLSAIFDKFRQADSSDTRSFEGIGLGLFIVKKYVELLGGEIAVASEGGKGSTFTVKLPCNADGTGVNPSSAGLPLGYPL